jgi:hypothetical protein
LSPADRNSILHTYSRTIEIFSKALTPPSVSSSSAYSDATLLVLEKSLGEIRKEISSS